MGSHAIVSIADIDYNVFMAVLNIRNLSDEVHLRLRVRAAKAGRSMEAEARVILSEVCGRAGESLDPTLLQELVESLYGDQKPSQVVEELIRERRLEASRE